MIRINPLYLCSAEDEEVVWEWLTNPDNEVHKIVQRRFGETNNATEALSFLEVPTGLTPSSDIGHRLLKVAHQNPQLLQLLIGHQSAILKIVAWEIPVRAEITDIMDVDNNFSVRPEVVIIVWEKW